MSMGFNLDDELNLDELIASVELEAEEDFADDFEVEDEKEQEDDFNVDNFDMLSKMLDEDESDSNDDTQIKEQLATASKETRKQQQASKRTSVASKKRPEPTKVTPKKEEARPASQKRVGGEKVQPQPSKEQQPAKEAPKAAPSKPMEVEEIPQNFMEDSYEEMGQFDVAVARKFISALDAYRKVAESSRSIIAQFVTDPEQPADEAEVIMGILMADELILQTAVALQEAKVQEPHERPFYVFALEDELLVALGSVIEVFAEQEIYKMLSFEMPEKIKYVRSICKFVEGLNDEVMQYAKDIEAVLTAGA